MYAGEQFTIRRFKVKLTQTRKEAKPRGSTVCRHNGLQSKAHNSQGTPTVLPVRHSAAAGSFAGLGGGKPTLFTARWPQQDRQGPTESDSAGERRLTASAKALQLFSTCCKQAEDAEQWLVPPAPLQYLE